MIWQNKVKDKNPRILPESSSVTPILPIPDTVIHERKLPVVHAEQLRFCKFPAKVRAIAVFKSGNKYKYANHVAPVSSMLILCALERNCIGAGVTARSTIQSFKCARRNGSNASFSGQILSMHAHNYLSTHSLSFFQPSVGS